MDNISDLLVGHYPKIKRIHIVQDEFITKKN